MYEPARYIKLNNTWLNSSFNFNPWQNVPPTILLLPCLYFASAYVQELTLYTEPDNGGNSFRFRTKEPDLAPYLPLLADMKSWCLQGQ